MENEVIIEVESSARMINKNLLGEKPPQTSFAICPVE